MTAAKKKEKKRVIDPSPRETESEKRRKKQQPTKQTKQKQKLNNRDNIVRHSQIFGHTLRPSDRRVGFGQELWAHIVT